MKNLFTLLIIAVGLFASTTTFAQGTKDAPWPGSTHTYSLVDGDTESADFTWWVATDPANNGATKADYGTGATDIYRVVGAAYDSGHPTDVADLKGVNIKWGNNIGAGPYYIFVRSGKDGCYNYRFYTVNPVNEFDAIVYDITKQVPSDYATVTTPLENNECPDLTELISETNTYNAGKTTFTFKVLRTKSLNAWTFDYAIKIIEDGTTNDITAAAVKPGKVTITGSYTAVSTGNNVTGTVNGVIGDDYFIVSVDVNNQEGKAIDILFEVTSASDATTSNEDPDTIGANSESVKHDLKKMPKIGAFEL